MAKLVQRGEVLKGKINPVCENQGPPEEKKETPPPKKPGDPTPKFLPKFHLYPEQNLPEKHIIKNVSLAAPNRFLTLIFQSPA